MDLRPPQKDFCRDSWNALKEFDKVLGIAPTGAGKTIMAAAFSRKLNNLDRENKTLFLVDRNELVTQTADKYQQVNNWNSDIEQGENEGEQKHPVTVASVQSLINRLHKYPQDFFKLVICDEAHKSLSPTYQTILNYFNCKKLGLTATPNITNGELGDYWETIGGEIFMRDLINDGFLSKIRIQTFPCPIKFDRSLLNSTGDYDELKISELIEQNIDKVIAGIKMYAQNRKILIFLPLVKTSEFFAMGFNKAGFNARHVSGKSKDRKEVLEWFSEKGPKILCNSMLLTYGYDQPDIDCVMILRPMRSNVLYCQSIGRGTRIAEGKDHLLVLDPLWLVDDHKLATPAALMQSNPADQKETRELIQEQGEGDLLQLCDDAAENRIKKLEKELNKKAKRKARLFDPFELAHFARNPDLAKYEPKFEHEKEEPTEKQKIMLEKFGIYSEEIENTGQASKLLSTCFSRIEKGLASFKQLRVLDQFKIKYSPDIKKDEAGEIITKLLRK